MVLRDINRINRGPKRKERQDDEAYADYLRTSGV